MNEKSPRNHRFRGLLLIGLQLECEIRFYAPDILCILSNRAVRCEAAGVCNVDQRHAVPLILIAVNLAYALLSGCVGCFACLRSHGL